MEAFRDLLASNSTVAKGFAIIYAITFIPAWLIVFYIGKQLAGFRKSGDVPALKRISAAIVAEVLVLLAPYLYLLLFLEELPMALKAVGLLSLIVAAWVLYGNLRRKHRIDD